jgi:hydrogenase/urease accessory protein HupE
MLYALPLSVLAAGTAQSHESRPLYVELTESAPQYYRVQWKAPPSVPSFGLPSVSLPDACAEVAPRTEVTVPDGEVRRAQYHCPTGLAGGTVTIRYPGPNPSISTLIRFSSASGQHYTAALAPDESRWRVPYAETLFAVARDYVRLGVEHIISGFDHLLFVLCLLWIGGSTRRILITISGFTLAHSLTLTLSALGLVRLPIPPIEASIALSIVFLAVELTKGPRDSLTWRHPVAVSSSFGLLHGLGFAAALGEIGLPQRELLGGLLFFNVGVEIGQLLFVAVVIGLVRVGRFFILARVPAIDEGRFRYLSGYAIGTLASLWLVERGSVLAFGDAAFR